MSNYLYDADAVRWRKFSGRGDVRAYRPARGWIAHAELIDFHPLTGKPFKGGAQWWICERRQECMA